MAASGTWKEKTYKEVGGMLNIERETYLWWTHGIICISLKRLGLLMLHNVEATTPV